MTRIENARSDAGAGSLKFGGFETQHTRTANDIQYQPRSAGQRFERMIERVHALGPRPLAEIAAATGQHVRVVDLVEEFARLDTEIVRALGADRFPPMPVGVVR